jgi:hypothetical protein
MFDMPPEVLQASAIQFLIDDRQEKAAKVLLSCTLDYTLEGSPDDPAETIVKITLSAPRPVYKILLYGYDNEEWFIPLETPKEYIAECRGTTWFIQEAFMALMPAYCGLGKIHVRAQLVEINPQWKKEFQAILERTDIHNQGVQFSAEQPVHIWKNLRFRSQTEIRVAEALDCAGVLFLPNCRARLGFKTRENREADFLVCCDGKWGILEIDSDRFHKSAADDHERDRLFKAHGIYFIDHVDQGECWENADGVVKKFLYLLRKQAR